MKLFTSFSILALVLSASVVSAQEAVFKVLAAKGEITSVESSNKNSLSAGKKLFKDQTIQVGGSGYVGLVHRTGKTMEIKAPGTYAVNELDKSFTANNAGSSVTKKYANYVFGEMTKEEEKNLKKNHQQFMAVTGAVSRSIVRTHGVKVNCPPTLATASIKTPLSWTKPQGTESFTIALFNMYDEVVWKTETSDTSMVLDFASLPGLKGSKMCVLKVLPKDKSLNTAGGYPIKFFNAEENTQFQNEYAAILETADGSAASKIVQAIFFETYGLNLNALQSYKEAIGMAPDVEDYRALFTDFLSRTGVEGTASVK